MNYQDGATLEGIALFSAVLLRLKAVKGERLKSVNHPVWGSGAKFSPARKICLMEYREIKLHVGGWGESL